MIPIVRLPLDPIRLITIDPLKQRLFITLRAKIIEGFAATFPLTKVLDHEASSRRD
jgi:hypothetical protein